MEQIDVLLTWPKDGLRLFESMIPIGLASIAGVLREAGLTVKTIDFNHYKRDFQRELRALRPRVVGIGGTTPTRKGSFLTARLVKKALPSCTTVYGGPHATFAATDTLQHVPEIDFVIKGESEFSFLSLCRKIISEEDTEWGKIDGLVYRTESGIKESRVKRIQDLSLLPMPARDLFEHNYPLKLDLFDVEADFIMTSRGCPTACDFCSAARMFPGGVRLRPMAQVKEEIEWIISRKAIRGLKIFDSTFTADREHVLQFCDMIRPFKLLWECEIRADTVDKYLLKQMKDAGCCYINMGLETTSERLLKKMGKMISVSQAEQVLEWCREIGIKTKVFFTFGHIDETYEECLNDIRYMHNIKDKIDFFATTVGMRIYPGTALERRAKSRGVLPQDFSWVSFRAPILNYLILEPSDIKVLSQPQLPLWRMTLLILRLFLQKTVLSSAYIKKMIRENIHTILYLSKEQLRFTRHRSVRAYLKLTGQW